ncbi:hypothetical protein QL285_034963 [Trifolium repens]|nr:hypothetical protein QL285_034959 [Trifolium repens]KAK2424619.1 hypothetical protein QL285_034961 [Trifolium repens]KAK2424621.1 hypothetical protein QL285_034963 [Trifolium repens]
MKKHRRFHHQEVLECFHPCSWLESTSTSAPMTNFPSKPPPWSMSFNLAFIVCLFSRTLCPASHPPRTLALISPTLVPNSRTLEHCSRKLKPCSRKLKGQNALGLFSHTFAHANLDFACANLNFYF